MDIKNGKMKDKFEKTLDHTNSQIDGTSIANTRFKNSIISSGRRVNLYQGGLSRMTQNEALAKSKVLTKSMNREGL